MKFGMTNEQFRLFEDLIVRPLKAHGAEAFIFGSRVSGNHHPNADVDVLYRMPGEQRIPIDVISAIREAIEESRFPFIVDLVDESDLVESYRANVLETMQPL